MNDLPLTVRAQSLAVLPEQKPPRPPRG